MDRVSAVRCETYDIDKLDKIIENQFQEFEKEKPLIKAGDKVVIKPNLIMRSRPENAATTHPELIAAIIRAVKRRGGNPIIAESPGGPYTKQYLHSIYNGTGIAAVAEREGAELNFDTGSVEVPTNGGKKVNTFEIINPIANADVVISAAKLKTHAQMTYSGAVKNLFGSIPGLKKPEFHYRFQNVPDFAAMLVDLCETIKPAISFIDGIVGMEGNGPTGGTPKKLGVIFAGTNPYAVDLAATAAIGFKAGDIPVLADAISRGLCPQDITGVELCGDGADAFGKFKVPDSVSLDFLAGFPEFIRKPLNKLCTPKPVIVKKKCIGCGKCAESCPQHTIEIKDRKAVIDYSKCIKCFCCHEMCPKQAINIKRFRLFGKRG